MKKLLALILFVLLIGGAWAQPTPTTTPPNPESLGIQIPQPTTGAQAPPTSESSQALVSASEASARAAAPSPQAAAVASTYMIVPPGTSAPNKFYIPYSPSTVASCYFGQWLPMWLDIRGSGPLYGYEWYPNGRLVTQYLAYISYPGWQKMWFYGDAPGWHTLQYYCNGWSNYIYVYVYGSSNYPQPSPTPYPPAPYPPTPGCNSQIVITSDWMRGYSVYVDGSYIGGDGRRGDHFDGTFSFSVTGNRQHTIRVYNQGFSYSQTKTYNCGQTYYLRL